VVDPDIQKRLDTKLERDFRFTRRVDCRSHTETAKERYLVRTLRIPTDKTSSETKGPTIRAAMYTVGSSYCSADDSFLRDSFLLDSGSEAVVCNSRDRVIDLRPVPPDAYLKGGVGYVKIERFGTVQLLSNLNQSTKGIVKSPYIIHDVAFAPMFPVNLVSYNMAMSKRFF
jgi:hypothetical protein